MRLNSSNVQLFPIETTLKPDIATDLDYVYRFWQMKYCNLLSTETNTYALESSEKTVRYWQYIRNHLWIIYFIHSLRVDLMSKHLSQPRGDSLVWDLSWWVWQLHPLPSQSTSNTPSILSTSTTTTSTATSSSTSSIVQELKGWTWNKFVTS